MTKIEEYVLQSVCDTLSEMYDAGLWDGIEQAELEDMGYEDFDKFMDDVYLCLDDIEVGYAE